MPGAAGKLNWALRSLKLNKPCAKAPSYTLSMKRVLIFSLAYYPKVGGAEVAIKEITDRIPDVEFHLVTLRFAATDAKEERMGNVVVHRVGSGGSYWSKILFIPDAAAAGIQLEKKYAFDAAWAMMSYMTLPLILMRLLGTRLPYALTLQEGDTEQHMFGRLRILPFLVFINHGFRGAQVVQAISTYLGEWARKRGFTGPLEIIPNGVDVARFTGDRAPHDGVVLITSSRLVRKNGVDTIIRALPLLPDVQLVVCGTGPEEAKLKSLARDLGVDGRIAWRGHVDHSELPRHLHHADIFVRPSRSEGMGNSFVEAFAAGVPVIATQVGGLKDFITPEVAWPVRPENPEDIAAAVRAIVQNPVARAEVVERAKMLVYQKYDWDIVARAMQDKVFAKII